MSDPTFSDIDFKNKMTWVRTALSYCLVLRYAIEKILDYYSNEEWTLLGECNTKKNLKAY